MKDGDNLDYLLKTFARGSFIVLIGIFFSKIASYLYKVIVARNFGQEIYGIFSLAILTFSLFSAFFSLGLPHGLLRYISFYRGKNEVKKIQSIIRFSSAVLLFASFIGAGLLFYFSEIISVQFFHNSGLIPFLQIFAIFIPISVFASLIHGITITYEKIGWYSFIGNILSPSTQLAFLITFIFLGLGVQSIIFSYVIGVLAILLSAFFVCKYCIKEIFPKPDIGKIERKEANKKLLSYSWPIMFLGVVTYLFSLIDSFSIGYLKTASDVGIYNAAVPLSYFLLISSGLFLQLFLPVITREYSQGNFKLIKDLSKQIGKWIFIINLPIMILMILFPGAVINLLFGPAYIQAENSLRFLSVGFFFYSIFLISENLLSMAGKSRITLINLAIASVVNLVLNILLIPQFGISGAAFSTMISYVLWGLLSLVIAKHFTSIVPLKWDMVKIVLVAIIPAMALFYIRKIITMNLFSILIMGISFFVIYFLLIFLTRSLDKNDLNILRAIKNKLLGRR